jgi:hypothetical protein
VKSAEREPFGAPFDWLVKSVRNPKPAVMDSPSPKLRVPPAFADETGNAAAAKKAAAVMPKAWLLRFALLVSLSLTGPFIIYPFP